MERVIIGTTLSIQMDEVLPSPPRKRKRPLSPKPPASQRPRLTKKLKIGLTPHNSFSGEPKTNNIPPKTRPVQKNALAGPSTQANASGQSRYSSRTSRPTAKKSATRIQKRAIVSGSDSDSDSDESFPSNILPKTPNNLKRGKISLSKEHKARESKAQGNGKVVHLGAIELFSDSGDDYPIKPPKKRPKRNEGKSSSSDIIDLCSDLEESLSPSKTPTRTRMENNVVIILSSDDEDHPSPNLFNSEMIVDNQDDLSPMETFLELPGTEDRRLELPNSQSAPEAPTSGVPNRVPSSRNGEISFECLQPSLTEHKSTNNKAGDKCSCFTASTSARPSRTIVFTGDLPNPILHTPGFFSRAVTAAKTAVLASQKRAKKRRFQALLLASSVANCGSRWTPVQRVNVCEPKPSTLDISPSFLATPEDAVDHCAELRTALGTYPEHAVPVPTEMQEPIALAHPKGIMGSESDQARVAYVHVGMEKHLEDSLKDPTSGDASPSVGEYAQDPQRDLAESVTLNSVPTTSAMPVLQSPPLETNLRDALSAEESNIGDSLDGSREPDHFPNISQRSISEIPQKMRLSAQCLVQVLNDISISKKFVDVTTPPAVVISPHVETSKSLADCSPISINDSTTSDPSDAESPLPVTPSDSQTGELQAPIATKTLTRCKTISILDFDLNNLNVALLTGDSKYDYDDDDLSLSGLELVYPEDVC